MVVMSFGSVIKGCSHSSLNFGESETLVLS